MLKKAILTPPPGPPLGVGKEGGSPKMCLRVIHGDIRAIPPQPCEYKLSRSSKYHEPPADPNLNPLLGPLGGVAEIFEKFFGVRGPSGTLSCP